MLESTVESRLIQLLVKNGYVYKDINNKKDLESNIVQHLIRLNKREEPLTEEEGRRILAGIKHAVKTRQGNDANSTGELNEALEFNKILNSRLTLTDIRKDDAYNNYAPNNRYIVFDKENLMNNKFEVIHQYIDNDFNNYRYDVTILMNGFPVIQIELKKPDVEVGHAVDQINKYIQTGGYTGLFRYLQLFVISNDTNTYYTVNNTGRNINRAFIFRWSDEHNFHKDGLLEFADTFLRPSNLRDIFRNYMIRYQVENRMVVMRPYQIYATKAVLKRALQPYDLLKNKNLDERRKYVNGYIWHTTGSGKTLTSWKCVQLLCDNKEIDYVFFLIDRRDLDAQTQAEFAKVANGALDVDATDSTKSLIERLEKAQTGQNKFTITTIQKLSNAVKQASTDENVAKILEWYKKRRVIFIVDECHRSQSGDMKYVIDKWFTNGIAIGFTGTPIMEENRGIGNTTRELFGNVLHTYQIKDAIQDRNVLGFTVEYYNTIDRKGEVKTELVHGINVLEALYSTTRIKSIVDKIYDIHDSKTMNRHYTALFTVDSIEMLLRYMNAFREKNAQLIEEGKPEKVLRVSAIYSEKQDVPEKQRNGKIDAFGEYKRLQDEYNEIFDGVDHVLIKNGNDDGQFRTALSKSLNVTKPYNEARHIDIVIVVNIFLTGFDSKRTNTLYVDRELEYHNLIQAFSRTNRVESERKTFGNIVCFRNLKDNVDKAIKLFNSSNSTDVVSKDYERILKDFEYALLDIAGYRGKNIHDLDSDIKQREFIERMRRFNKVYTEAKQSESFDWDKLAGKHLTKDEYESLVGVMKGIKREVDSGDNTSSILNNIDFCMELAEKDTIDVNYIKALIASGVDMKSREKYEKSLDNIADALGKSGSDTLVNNRDLIEEFIKKMRLEYDTLTEKEKSDVNTIKNKFNEFIDQKKNEDISVLTDAGLTEESIDKKLIEQDITGMISAATLRDELRDAGKVKGMSARKKIVEFATKFIQIFKDRYENLKI